MLALVTRHRRLVSRGDRSSRSQLVRRLPDAHGEAGEERGAERGRLADSRDVHRDAEHVRLELHEETVGRAATVRAQHGDALSGGGHRLDEIARLVGDALERRAREVRACGTALDPDEQTARVHVPVRRAEAGERRNEVDAVVARETRRERLGLVRARDDAEAVPEPLHRGAGDEGAPLERVADAVADVPRDRGQQTAARRCRGCAGIREEEAPRSVGVLRLAGREAGLPEQRGLLIARDPRDGQRGAEVRGIRRADDAHRRHRRREHRPRQIERGQELVVPAPPVDVEHHRA